MDASSSDLCSLIVAWANREPTVRALVLFGSRARRADAVAASDRWSDLDLQVITSAPRRVESRTLAESLPGQQLCLHVVRPASGGVRKVTLIFASGEIDMIVIPAAGARRVRWATQFGLHRRLGSLRHAMNELSTIMRGGYRFLKGEKEWGGFYARMVGEMPGQRLDDREAARIADVFLCDLLWVFQKIDRGELVAAQRVLHRSLAETNFQLLHEARLRRSQPTFREARRVEKLLSADQLAPIQISSRLEVGELRRASRHAYAGLIELMAQLAPAWAVVPAFAGLLAPYLARGD